MTTRNKQLASVLDCQQARARLPPPRRGTFLPNHEPYFRSFGARDVRLRSSFVSRPVPPSYITPQPSAATRFAHRQKNYPLMCFCCFDESAPTINHRLHKTIELRILLFSCRPLFSPGSTPPLWRLTICLVFFMLAHGLSFCDVSEPNIASDVRSPVKKIKTTTINHVSRGRRRPIKK